MIFSPEINAEKMQIGTNDSAVKGKVKGHLTFDQLNDSAFKGKVKGNLTFDQPILFLLTF